MSDNILERLQQELDTLKGKVENIESVLEIEADDDEDDYTDFDDEDEMEDEMEDDKDYNNDEKKH